MSYDIEVVRKVFDNDHGTHIVVQPDTDGLELVEIIGAQDYGGDIRLPPQHALLLAEAIKACAIELGAKEAA